MQWSVFRHARWATFLVLVGCAQPRPATPRFESVSALTSSPENLDRPAFEMQHGGRLADTRRSDLERVARRLNRAIGSDAKPEIDVLNTWARNAYALSTGHIYVTRGMFDAFCREDDIAAVIAHELAHLQDPESFLAAGFSSDQRLMVEVDADARAVVTLIDAGFDPSALIAMIDRLAPEQPDGWAHSRCQYLREILGE